MTAAIERSLGGYRGLPVREEPGRVVIGPSTCPVCFELRRSLDHRPPVAPTALACDTVAALVADEIEALERTTDAVLFVDLASLRVTRHRFLPEPLCPRCGNLPDDGPEVLSLRSRPKRAPDNYRVGTLPDVLDTYFDAETGMIRVLERATLGGLAVTNAVLPTRDGDIEVGCGQTRDYRSSERTAVLEALERWGGFQPGGKRTSVRSSYRELAGQALDPRQLGTHAPEDYLRPGFRYRPFDADEVLPWVWGYSFGRAEPILVPESVAYYRTGGRLVYECSNGCALGGCLEEAILHGILEVAERDAFLYSWYTRTPPFRVDLDSARDRSVPVQAAAIELATGYRLSVYDTTTETGVPCAWAMAVSPSDAFDIPKVVCAGGAHLDLERAVLNALGEVGHVTAVLRATFPALAAKARLMIDDPDLVVELEDHTTLYGAHEAFDRFSFLDSSPVRAFGSPVPGAADLRDDLLFLVDRYLSRGMDVIVVDQTTPEHRISGLSCVKVIIPGTVPITFGHANRRLHGLPRLAGFSLNPNPHPFP
ncbi:SagD family biosynthesis docking scaffold protein [Lentzea sp. NBRC 105346]|uniref:TOMM precursor leader peptide-binding protein n=1 Tax=Lentzea sp. NBRC 105346 TaxID=3032205 RepID=UPI0024A17C57|nr:TOMM precursor leader peptide-binding protein [Lentzea sp. NBRC 105346]GLZ31005.1 SagD family biosynthesis docking scaffold protein [Lentzea sp. NBRC 105346]